MKRLSSFLVVAAALWATVPVTAVSAASATKLPAASASAWALRIAATAPSAQEVIQLGGASARSGDSPSSWASPLVIAGQSPLQASVVGTGDQVATSVKDQLCTPINQLGASSGFTCGDPTGSLLMDGGFAEAHASNPGSSARTGFGSMTASGFPMASQTMTWDQQVQMLAAWGGTWDQLIGNLNARLEPLAPTLALAGIKPPHFEPWTGLGLVDIAKSGVVASNVDVSSSNSYVKAVASTSISNVRMFAGFIEAEAISLAADSESSGDPTAGEVSETRESSVRIGRLKIAGVEVVDDADGFRVAGNDVLSRAVVQPALDGLLWALQQGGLTIHVSDKGAKGNMRQASALSVEMKSTSGSFILSAGYVEATSDNVVASTPVVLPPVGGGEIPTVLPTEYTPVNPEPVSGDIAPIVAPTAPGSDTIGRTPGGTGGQAFRPLPQSAVRSARTTYLLLVLLGGLVSALILPMLARPAPVRRLASVRKEIAR